MQSWTWRPSEAAFVLKSGCKGKGFSGNSQMFSEKSVGKHAFFLLIDRIKGKEGGIHYIIYTGGRRYCKSGRDCGGCRVCGYGGCCRVWWVLQGVVGVAGCGGCCRVWRVLQELSTEIKKSFFSFLPSHPHKCGSSALFIGVSRVRVSVRVELLPSHLPSHFPHTSGTGKHPVRVSVCRI